LIEKGLKQGQAVRTEIQDPPSLREAEKLLLGCIRESNEMVDETRGGRDRGWKVRPTLEAPLWSRVAAIQVVNVRQATGEVLVAEATLLQLESPRDDQIVSCDRLLNSPIEAEDRADLPGTEGRLALGHTGNIPKRYPPVQGYL
jgi:hypothetical protein